MERPNGQPSRHSWEDAPPPQLPDNVLFEPPSRWESILAPGLQEVAPLSEGLGPAPSGCGENGCLEGDYCSASDDISSESFLRILADGQWWHAAHRVADSGSPLGPENWQLAECIGSWHRVPIPADAADQDASPEPTPAVGLMLLCENFRWATDLDGRLPPELQQLVEGRGPGSSEVEEAVVAGRVVFCYAVCECRLTGARRLELRMPGVMCSSSSDAQGALGFASQYYKADDRRNGHPPPELVFLSPPS